MSNIVIKAEDISKQYRLGLVGTNTLKGDLQSWWYRMRGKEDPTLKIGHENRLDTSDGEYVWALKDINFEIKQGDVVGIIGKNGAGKSTLLKIISRITTPTTGQIKVKGRIASLLEVGTGFQGDLTGRENIFLNGAILGMKKDEIRRKFDEIVDFSGVGAYIDTPVKRYSSGMYVRLAFAVAAHLEPEILIIDEVLAVGDADFQKKALGKMQDISTEQGRTVLFVSHNMAAVQKLCTKGIVIKEGLITFQGNIDKAIDNYFLKDKVTQRKVQDNRDNDRIDKNKKLLITSLSVEDEEKRVLDEFNRNEVINICISFEVLRAGIGYNTGIEIWTNKGDCVLSTKINDADFENLNLIKSEIGIYSYIVELPTHLFKDGDYIVTAASTIPLKEVLDIFPLEVGFKVRDINSAIFKSGEGRNGNLFFELKWNKY